MADDPKTTFLAQYRPKELAVDCPRCNRRKVFRADKALKQHGNITLAEFARRVAEQGGCALADAGENLCTARVEDLPIEAWGKLDDALREGWQGFIVCCRKLESLKRGKGCEEATPVDIASLISILGFDYSLANLPARTRCPLCGTEAVEMYWRVPPKAPDPGGASEGAPVLQLRPSRAAMGRKRFKVMEGGR